MLPRIYIDECGHTGEDLANRDDPVFVVASHNIGEDEARQWKDRYFARVRSDELKHSHLQRRAAHQRAVTDFMNAVLTEKRVCASLAHKRFALVAKLIDWLIEAGMHEDGFDLYERGGNMALANVVYFSLLAKGEACLRRVIESFQRAARTRRPDLMSACNPVLLSTEVQDALGEVGQGFMVSIAKLDLDWVAKLPARSLALPVTVALGVCYAWRRRGMTSFEIVHDRSGAMAREQDVWELILSREAPTAIIGHAEFQVQFPIGVERTQFEDSRNSVSLRLADVIAGTLARWAVWITRGRPATDSYAGALDGVILPHLIEAIDAALWPIPDVEPRAAAPAHLIDALEYLTRLLAANGVKGER